jgi:hypothetical protein
VTVDVLRQISQNVAERLDMSGLSASTLVDLATTLGLIAGVVKRDLRRACRHEQTRALDAVLAAVFGLDGLDQHQMADVIRVAHARLDTALESLAHSRSTTLSA